MSGPARVNLSLAAYPGVEFVQGVQLAREANPSEPLLGLLAMDHVQLCPQNRGILDEGCIEALKALYPQIQFRLHANVRIGHKRQVTDWSAWETEPAYWQGLARASRQIGAPAYTAHAGLRREASLTQILDAARHAQDLFGVPVGIEGHYPTHDDQFLVSSWEEYQALFESGVPYALDLSHLNIVAKQSRRRETGLVAEMLACERCIEVHVSDNDGRKDSHAGLTTPPWWWELMGNIHDKAVVFSEGQQDH